MFASAEQVCVYPPPRQEATAEQRNPEISVQRNLRAGLPLGFIYEINQYEICVGHLK